MIVTRRFASNATQQMLGDFASDYAKQLVLMMGQDPTKRIEIGRVLIRRKEALDYFLTKVKGAQVAENDPVKRDNFRSMIRNHILQGAPFVNGMDAYTPIKNLGAMEHELIKDLNPKPESRLKSLCATLTNNYRYRLLHGWGAEIGHVVGYGLYGQKAQEGIGEAIDLASHFLEDRFDVACVKGARGVASYDDSHVSHRSKIRVDNILATVRLMDTLLFEGEAETMELLATMGTKSFIQARAKVKELKEVYLRTPHYDGLTLFVTSLHYFKGGYQTAIKGLGEVFADPVVTNTVDALKRMGVVGKELVRYEKTFSDLQGRLDNFSQRPGQRLLQI